MELREYCKCGGQLTGSAFPDKAAIEAQRLFWDVHSGQGHGAVKTTRCYSARYNQEAANAGAHTGDYCDLED